MSIGQFFQKLSPPGKSMLLGVVAGGIAELVSGPSLEFNHALEASVVSFVALPLSHHYLSRESWRTAYQGSGYCAFGMLVGQTMASYFIYGSPF